MKVQNVLNSQNNTIPYEEYLRIHHWVNRGKSWVEIGVQFNRSPTDLENHHNTVTKIKEYLDYVKNSTTTNSNISNSPPKIIRPILPKPNCTIIFHDKSYPQFDVPPIAKTPNIAHENAIKLRKKRSSLWTPELNSFITNVIQTAIGRKVTWQAVSMRVLETFNITLSPNRIRSHYIDKLDPSIKLTNITEEESQQIKEWVQKDGHRWTKFGELLNRPANAIKNHFHAHIKQQIKNNHIEASLRVDNELDQQFLTQLNDWF